MDLIRNLYVRADAYARGQTMAEYALLLAAVVVIVYAGYQTLGTTLTTALTNVNNTL
jgi:Flp pilus assembly pilin Flp